MSVGSSPDRSHEVIGMADLGGRERYQLITSLIAPRPIGWISTRSASGHRNLAPFSYFAPVSPTPPLISVAIGSRRGTPKDTLSNIRETGAFCVNVVTVDQLAEMNASSGEHPPEIDEFEIAGLEAADATTVDAPYVRDCPAILECRFYRELPLDEAGVAIVIGEITAILIDPRLGLAPGTHLVDPDELKPVGRLGGELYGFLGEIRALSRPIVPG